ncbi:MAG: phosphatidate cytidylyltransferase [Clostridia bacterium]|nr:phosphatidate cytidylyltransferase [Clostridia bacterium]
MKTRIITAICAIAIFVPICIFSDTLAFPIAFAIICAVGVYEMAKCIGMNKNLGLCIPIYLVALGLPMLAYFDVIKPYFFIIAVACVFLLLIYSLAYVMFRLNRDKITDVMSLFALCIYVILCFTSVVNIRYMDNGNYYYLLIFIGAWVCDTFAYFTGKFLGRHKLIPAISPKKTIEGSIGGIAFTIGAFALYGFILRSSFGFEMSYIELIIMGAVVAIVSQIGDLIASAVKRQYEIKDYGFLFPGHGGVLDRFDSVMLVSPFLFIVISVLNLI